MIVNLLQLAVKDRTQLALENIALRHQLVVYKRSVERPNINDGDRIPPRPPERTGEWGYFPILRPRTLPSPGHRTVAQVRTWAGVALRPYDGTVMGVPTRHGPSE